MLKNLNYKGFNYTLRSTQETNFSFESFLNDFPHVYFKPKNCHYELFCSGAIDVANDYLATPDELIAFCTGSTCNSQDWGDLGGIFCFIPKKWAFKIDHVAYIYELIGPSVDVRILKKPHLKQPLSPQKHLDRLDNIISKCQEQVLHKCIYAIHEQLTLEENFKLDQLLSFKGSGTKFSISWTKDLSFCGLTPETLYQRKRNRLKIDALAGTTKKENQQDLQSKKLRDEFEFVKRDIINVTNDYALGSFLPDDLVLTHHNLAHLYNQFKAQLLRKMDDQEIISTLHPTSAISGWPRKQAIELAARLESFERGHFASPVGFYSKNRAFISVGIRSMLIDGKSCHLFAGAGITKDSIPYEEYKELESKLELMKSLVKAHHLTSA